MVKGAWAAHDRLDPEITLCLAEGWTFARLGFLLRACLRAGAFELAERTDVPVKVVINEYVELAYLFFDAGEPAFVNAVLDRLAPDAAGGRTGAMSMGEFELIDRLLRPLARGFPGRARTLSDDAALVDVPPGRQLVVAKDAIVADVHFLADDPPELVAGKLLRVNLSDLAAMGAEPLGYLTAIARPPAIDDAWLRRFAAGLMADQQRFGCHLLGGDTTSTTGPAGAVADHPRHRAQRQGAAALGRRGPVTTSGSPGTLGDAAIGLRVLRGLAVTEDEAIALVDRYRTPRPRLALGQALRGLATAAIDVSDGLVADLGHICAASGVAAAIDALAAAAVGRRARRARRTEAALTGGDDYELLFTAPPERRARDRAARWSGSTMRSRASARIEPGPASRSWTQMVSPLPLARRGWRHF